MTPWSFIDHNAGTLSKNHRLAQIFSSWQRVDPDKSSHSATALLQKLDDGEMIWKGVGRYGLQQEQHSVPKIIKKAELPTKTCASCGLPFVWRRKWAKNWNDVKFCSDRCRHSMSVRTVK
jgi:hypothetical protein